MPRKCVNAYIWTKDKLEFLVKHYRLMKIKDLAESIGTTTQVVYNKVHYLGLATKKTPAQLPRVLSANMIAAIEKIKEANAVPWPKPTTNMKRALNGRDFGGNAVVAGTKNPLRRITRWNGEIGSFKSSMGD